MRREYSVRPFLAVGVAAVIACLAPSFAEAQLDDDYRLPTLEDVRQPPDPHDLGRAREAVWFSSSYAEGLGGAWAGAGLGLLAGALVGFVPGLAVTCSIPSSGSECWWGGFLGSAVVGGVGWLIGTALGTAAAFGDDRGLGFSGLGLAMIVGGITVGLASALSVTQPDGIAWGPSIGAGIAAIEIVFATPAFAAGLAGPLAGARGEAAWRPWVAPSSEGGAAGAIVAF